MDLVFGCPPPSSTPSGDYRNRPIVDDPSPLYHQGKYHLLARSSKGPLLHFYSYDASLQETDAFTVDLEPTVGDRNVTQNALIEIDGQVYLIAGFPDGPPLSSIASSSLRAIPLSNDLHSVSGSPVDLRSESDEFNGRVTNPIYAGGKLYMNGVNRWGTGVPGVNETVEYLYVFDVANDFSMMERIEIQRGTGADSHSSLAVLNGKVFFFYQSGDRRILVKIFEWQ